MIDKMELLRRVRDSEASYTVDSKVIDTLTASLIAGGSGPSFTLIAEPDPIPPSDVVIPLPPSDKPIRF